MRYIGESVYFGGAMKAMFRVISTLQLFSPAASAPFDRLRSKKVSGVDEPEGVVCQEVSSRSFKSGPF